MNTYTIKMHDVAQNDFRRYITHAAFYKPEDLHLISLVIKNEFSKQLEFMDGVEAIVQVQVLESDTYNVFIVFDFVKKDVHFKVTYDSKEHDSWVTLLNFSSKNQNHINLTEIDNNWFLNCVEKPTKLLIAMYYNQIAKFINKSCKELQNAQQFVSDVIKNLEEQNKQDEKEVTNTENVDKE